MTNETEHLQEKGHKHTYNSWHISHIQNLHTGHKEEQHCFLYSNFQKSHVHVYNVDKCKLNPEKHNIIAVYLFLFFWWFGKRLLCLRVKCWHRYNNLSYNKIHESNTSRYILLQKWNYPLQNKATSDMCLIIMVKVPHLVVDCTYGGIDL